MVSRPEVMRSCSVRVYVLRSAETAPRVVAPAPALHSVCWESSDTL